MRVRQEAWHVSVTNLWCGERFGQRQGPTIRLMPRGDVVPPDKAGATIPLPRKGAITARRRVSKSDSLVYAFAAGAEGQPAALDGTWNCT